MIEYQLNWNSKIARKAKQDLDKPRLTNLNEDPMLSGVVHHYMKADAKVTIGRKDADPKPDVALTGLGVQKNHAVISCEESVYKIEPGQSNAKVKVNGKPISSGMVHVHPLSVFVPAVHVQDSASKTSLRSGTK